MKYFVILLLFLGIEADSGKVDYSGYVVYRVIPVTDKQFNALLELEQANTTYDFWKRPTAKNVSVDIMVSPQQTSQFKKFTSDLQMNPKVFIPNVQQLINESTPNNKPRTFGWTNYNTLADIYSWMNALAKQYPKKVQVINAGSSYEGRAIKGVKVSLKTGNKAIFIEGGTHAREWISPATVTYMLNQLLTSTDDAVKSIAQSYDWYFFPVINPDGYEYTMTYNRTWRKTRKPYGICKGADPNRNWGYHWMSGGASSISCDDTYGGPSVFSEPETRALSNFIKSIHKNLIGYLTFHSYSQLILIPYGYTQTPVNNYEELMDIGTKAAASLSKRYGTQYTVGNIVDILYLASGSSIDWVKGTYNIPITFTYELRDLGKYAFLLPPQEIIPTGQETLDSLVTIIQEAKKRGY